MLQLSDLSRDQREAYSTIQNWAMYNTLSQPILTFGGFAGCGKTSVLGVFARENRWPIAFCAYTGKAASVLKRKLLENDVQTRDRVVAVSGEDNPYADRNGSIDKPFVGTIHSLIYKPILGSVGNVVDWEPRTELDADYKLIVVDEASMVSEQMLSDLRGYGIQILMVGDHAQLPPVGGLGSLMLKPHVRLETIHRQAEGNPIVQLSAEIRKTGRFNRALADGKHIFFAPMSHLTAIIGKRYRGVAGSDLFKLATLTYTNRRRSTVNALTRTVLRMSGAPKVGEQIVCLRNDKAKGIYNGMRGLITRDQGRHKSYPWQLQAEVDFVEDNIKTNVTMCAQQFNRDRTFDDFSDVEAAILETAHKEVNIGSWKEVGGLFDLAYAATTHKFQGSSVDDVLLIAERPGPVDDDTWKRWKYTSVTRAVHRLTIVE